MDVKPLGDFIILEPIKPPEKIGSFFIPQTAMKETNRGKVLSLGDGRIDIYGKVTAVSEDIKVGDEVAFVAEHSRKTTIQGKEVILLREKDILAVYIDE